MAGSSSPLPEVGLVLLDPRGHRPVVMSEVPIYVSLRDQDGRLYEDKWNSPGVRHR